jgi:hypothetical protein
LLVNEQIRQISKHKKEFLNHKKIKK